MAETQTKTKGKAADDVQQAQPIARLAASRMPIVGSLAKEFDVTPDQWRVLVDQIFPAARTVEAIGMALAYCRARNLDIYKRPVHIVPMYSSALKRMVETVWPGIAEIRTTAHRTGNYAGIDPVKWGEIFERTFVEYVDTEMPGEQRRNEIVVEFPEYAEVTVYRMVEGQRMPFTAQVFWEESYATRGRGSDIPNEMWMRRVRGQLAKCVEAAALRMAFPEELGNIYAAEEMEGKTIDVAPNDPTPTKPATLPDVPPDEPAPVAPSGSQPASGGETSGETAASAGDFNNDDSGVSLHKTDQPGGGKSEVTHPVTGEVMTNTNPAPNWDTYFERLEEEMAAYGVESEFVAAWGEYGVDTATMDNDDARVRAAKMRTHHLARIDGINRTVAETEQGQGTLFMPDVPE